MNKKKLIRNILFIVVMVYGYCYFHGYYLSREACVNDSVRGLYANTYEEIMVFDSGDQSVTVMANLEEMTCSFIETRKVGPFYHIELTLHWYEIGNSNRDLYVMSSHYLDDSNMYIVAYRINKEIDYVKVVLRNGETFVLDDWAKDFSSYAIDSDEWVGATYYAYNANHQLIEERVF